MDKLSTFNDYHTGLMSRFCYRDPFANFNLCSEDFSQCTGPEEQPFIPLTPEFPPTENFYSKPCAFPFQVPCGNFDSCSPAFIRKRNERERQRVKCVNEGYAKLRHHLPTEYLAKRLSKVETLRAAIKYIKYLQSLLYEDSEEGDSGTCYSAPGLISK